MEYHEAVNDLERLRRLRPKLGTETTAALLETVGDPHEGMATVQVAGSNGKGSTARTLERVLREAGVDVGLYTSPDLNDLRERIRVGGQKIPKRTVARFVDVVWPSIVDRAVDGDEPTFFEAFTVLALWHFDREDVDVAILEVGIGGRYDATSVVDPVASAVTSVSLEHTDIIGSTVEEIARDKAQVAPADGPLVTGATGAALDAIRGETAVVTVGGEDADVTATETPNDPPTTATVSVAGPDWAVAAETTLLGAHQATNAGVAATLARQLDARTEFEVSDEAIAAGIRNVTAPGRFELMETAPLVVLDGAHNPGACETLAATLDRFAYDDCHLVFGAMRDKDHAAMCEALPAADAAYLAEPETDRARRTDALAAVFERATGTTPETFGSVAGALDRALRAADPGDCVLATGSLYVVAEARDRWTRIPRTFQPSTPRAARAVMERADASRRTRRERADETVGRTVRFHARRGMADRLATELRSLGGTAAVSAITDADQHVEAVLSGTHAELKRLVGRVRGWEGRSSVVAALTDALDIGVDAGGDHPWANGTAVMGILNATPDSFHDGGEYDTVERAVARAETMVAEGADIVDVGGESTRPGADPVPVETEIDRVVPVIEAVAGLDAQVSVDTRKPPVARAALEAGADIVNDVTGLSDAAMRRTVAEYDVPAVCMHSLAAPVDPNRSYAYDDVVDDVLEALSERLLLAERAGIDRSQLVVDPGLGFGKRSGESFALLDRLDEFHALGCPVMVGHSHKSMFADVATDPDDRLAATVAATALAAERGADVVRVHDVAPNADAVRTAARTIGEE
ncbi:dihydropteroate synthase [Halobaculum gomorrense]|uniref:Probable bifunctional folylpolyglutamate synthase/dihydropteroate synthase n=1 Tax=Halobaculum gomorrense TaxID=43928 RepID=A0A1M5PEX5_9EURY|nr:dihydropteroate synthase [Halobaculum gomorrense]SHH00049.1 dihydropteroate synthase [Halobaculum gomorrense]